MDDYGLYGNHSSGWRRVSREKTEREVSPVAELLEKVKYATNANNITQNFTPGELPPPVSHSVGDKVSEETAKEQAEQLIKIQTEINEGLEKMYTDVTSRLGSIQEELTNRLNQIQPEIINRLNVMQPEIINRLNLMQPEILNKLTQLQFEVLTLKQLLKEYQEENSYLKELKSKVPTNSKFSKLFK